MLFLDLYTTVEVGGSSPFAGTHKPAVQILQEIVNGSSPFARFFPPSQNMILPNTLELLVKRDLGIHDPAGPQPPEDLGEQIARALCPDLFKDIIMLFCFHGLIWFGLLALYKAYAGWVHPRLKYESCFFANIDPSCLGSTLAASGATGGAVATPAWKPAWPASR